MATSSRECDLVEEPARDRAPSRSPMHVRPLTLALPLLALVLAGLAWFVASDERRVAAAPLSLAPEDGAASVSHADALDDEGVGTERDARATSRGAIAPALAPAATHSDAPRRPRVHGRVIDASGAPVRGARVRATTSVRFTEVPLDVERDALPRRWFTLVDAESGADGRFEIDALQPGPLRFVVHASGHAPHARDGAGRFDGRTDVDVGDVRLEPGIVLRGRVVDPLGEGVAGASVVLALECAHRASHARFPGRGVLVATSAADGTFVVDELSSGPWKLCVDAPGFRVREIEGQASRGSNARDEIVVRLEHGARITGRVAAPQAALRAEMRVVALPAGSSNDDDGGAGADAVDATFAAARPRAAPIQRDGTFVVDGLEPRSRAKLAVEVRASDGVAWKRAPSADAPLVEAGASGVEIAWTQLASLRLRAIDAATGAPIEELVAWSVQGRERALRDDTGAIARRFEGGVVAWTDVRVQAGKPFGLRLRAPGCIDRVIEDVQLALGADVDLGDVLLERSAQARVRVVDAANGAPIPAAVVASAIDPALDLSDFARRLARPDADGEVGVRVARSGADGIARLALAASTTTRAVAIAAGYLASEPFELTSAASSPANAATSGPTDDVSTGSRSAGEVAARDAADLEGDSSASRAHRASKSASSSPASSSAVTSSVQSATDAHSAEGSTTAHARDAELVVVALRRGGTVRVVVRDDARMPVAGAVVEHALPERGGNDERELDVPRETDAHGEARFDALAPGQHRFRVRTELEAVWSEGDEPQSEWTPLVVAATDGEAVLELAAAARATFEGIVREGGRALDGAQLKLVPRERANAPGGAEWRPSGDRASCASAADGAFAFPPLACGDYALFVAHPARRMVARFDVRIDRGGTRREIDLDVASVEGRVTDDRGEPIAGLAVRVLRVEERAFELEPPGRAVLVEDERGGANVQWRGGANENARTDARGHYVLRGLEAGVPIVVDVGGGGYERRTTEPFVLGPTEVRTGVDFDPRPTGWIRVDFTGPRRADTTWLLRLVDENEVVTWSANLHGATRRRVIPSILPGSYGLELCAPDSKEAAARTNVVVQANAVATSVLVYP